MRTELSTRERARQTAAAGGVPRSRPRAAAQEPAAGRESPAGRAPRSGRGSQPRPEASAGAGTRTRTKPRPAPQPRTRPQRRGPQPPSPRLAPVRTGAALPGAAAGATTATRPEAGPAAAGGSRRLGVPRTPFVLLVLGLLGGGLICLLVINTTLATASFHINKLQQGNVTLSQQQQSLQQQIAKEQSPGSIAHRAYKLGMRYQTHVSFLNSRTGRISRQPGTLPGVPIVPGFTP
jgi:hypothetical protein